MFSGFSDYMKHFFYTLIFITTIGIVFIFANNVYAARYGVSQTLGDTPCPAGHGVS